jgi:ornithine carbamoyltransferase
VALDFLRLTDRSPGEIADLLDLAVRHHAAFSTRLPRRTLAGKRVAFVWDGEGFRNRVAFEIGVTQLGGIGVEIPERLGAREPIDDLGRYLDNWFQAIVVRTPSLELLQELADAATAPVINARTDDNHPCEILGDLAFVRTVRGSLDGLRVTFLGEASNLCHSWCEAAAALPIEVTQVCPPGYEVDEAWWQQLTPRPQGTVAHTEDLTTGLRGADVVYTDCWPASEGGAEGDRVAQRFSPLQVTAEALQAQAPSALFLPCPPVTRGREVSDDAMESPQCRVVEAKGWLLHAQNALLETSLG